MLVALAPPTELKEELDAQRELALEENFAVRKKNCNKEKAVICESTLKKTGQIRSTDRNSD